MTEMHRPLQLLSPCNFLAIQMLCQGTRCLHWSEPCEKRTTALRHTIVTLFQEGCQMSLWNWSHYLLKTILYLPSPSVEFVMDVRLLMLTFLRSQQVQRESSNTENLVFVPCIWRVPRHLREVPLLQLLRALLMIFIPSVFYKAWEALARSYQHPHHQRHTLTSHRFHHLDRHPLLHRTDRRYWYLTLLQYHQIQQLNRPPSRQACHHEV